MTTFKEFLLEGVNDKGIFKALWVIGAPGAGKSYTIKRISGGVMPRVVNTDIAAEYLARKLDTPINSDNWGSVFMDKTHKMTKQSLMQYLNGALPLFIDGTSNDASNLLHRMGILESLGYDVGIVLVTVPLKTAIARVNARAEKINRHVDEDFVKRVHRLNYQNAEFLKSRVSFFRQIENTDELTDEVMQEIFKSVQGFFEEPIKNPIGLRTVKQLQKSGEKVLIPSIVEKQVLANKVAGWYKH